MTTSETLREALSRPVTSLRPTAGWAAVSAIFTADLDLLLLKRTEHPNDPWSGHLSFPGGRVEPEEEPLDAARRETVEEVGLDLHDAQLLGRLDDLAAVGGRPGMVIRPYVFLLPGQLPPLRPNPSEVAGTHTVALSDLLSGEGRTTMTWERGDQRLTLPAVELRGLSHPRLWGLTLRMVDDLLHRIDGRGVGLKRGPT